MEFETKSLIQELRALTQAAQTQALSFKSHSAEELNYKTNSTAWSVLECLEHLNRYGNFYLPEIEKCMLAAKSKGALVFKSGLLGGYFVKMIKATNAKKIKASKEMDTTGAELSLSTVDQFIKQVEWLDRLLLQAEGVNLTKEKTAISLTRLIKLRLGDTLRFVVYHNERHINQAREALSQAL